MKSINKKNTKLRYEKKHPKNYHTSILIAWDEFNFLLTHIHHTQFRISTYVLIPPELKIKRHLSN